jgi:hypothetical protein
LWRWCLSLGSRLTELARDPVDDGLQAPVELLIADDRGDRGGELDEVRELV